jgi:hypothetical protein
MQKLSGKSILFIGPQFFGYEYDIASELVSEGAEVDFLPDRPFTSPFMKAVTRYQKRLITPFANKFILDSVERFGRKNYDIIFVLQGEGLSLNTLSKLRGLFPNAQFVWYLWDSLSNKKSLIPNLSAFDSCYSFDLKDCKVYGMNFRPLYFSPGFEYKSIKIPKYQLSFIGTAHSDRFQIISNLVKAIPDETICFWYLYLQARWVFWFQKIANRSFRYASISDFNFEPMMRKEVQGVFFDSLAILDIEHPNQTGLTMRTFEAMGAHKKLITTNALIKEADFYIPDNILVIERNSLPKIPEKFLNTPYIAQPECIYQKYSIKGWLQDVLYSSWD